MYVHDTQGGGRIGAGPQCQEDVTKERWQYASLPLSGEAFRGGEGKGEELGGGGADQAPEGGRDS